MIDDENMDASRWHLKKNRSLRRNDMDGFRLTKTDDSVFTRDPEMFGPFITTPISPIFRSSPLPSECWNDWLKLLPDDFGVRALAFDEDHRLDELVTCRDCKFRTRDMDKDTYYLHLVDGKCWKCHEPMKMALWRYMPSENSDYIPYEPDKEIIYGPSGTFMFVGNNPCNEPTKTELHLASNAGAYVQWMYSESVQRHYMANTCEPLRRI